MQAQAIHVASADPITIGPEVAIHEAGHLVVGLRLGLDEQGIAFRPFRHGEAAGAWCKRLDFAPDKAIIRSLAGLLAHLYLLPATILPHLRIAYEHSVIIDVEHPHHNNLTGVEREFLSGAKTDVQMAWSYASQMVGRNEQKALGCLRAAERKARLHVKQCAEDIRRVAADIGIWAKEPDREYDVMLLYTPNRATAAIGSI